MAYVDSKEERSRLERVYADMNEGELRSVAKDGVSLTSEAIKALRSEISRRGVDIAVTIPYPTRRPASQTEFTTRHGLTILGIIAGVGLGFIVLVLSFPEWFAGCVRGSHLRQWW
jgi:hypothetical protein